jgi:hypothetical protein
MINMHPCHQFGMYQSSYAITLSHIGLVFRLSLITKTKLGTLTGSDPQEIQAHEVPEVDEQEEDLPECVDHQPNSFERGKPRSILSLLLYKSNSLYI